MKYIEIKRWDNQEVIHNGNFESVKHCLEHGVKNGISFAFADLCGVDLSCSELYYANLFMANLSNANLDNVNLNESYLYDIDISNVSKDHTHHFNKQKFAGGNVHLIKQKLKNKTLANVF